MLVTQTQFAFEARMLLNMAVGSCAFDLEIARQHGARQGHDDLFAGGFAFGAPQMMLRGTFAVLRRSRSIVADVHGTS